jgi:hypothetical protein
MTVEVRLENLERKLAETNAELNRVRRRNLWLLGGGILIAGLLALPWMFKDARRSYQIDAAVHKKIRANNFALVDEQGRDRAELLITKVGEGPGLVLRDEEGYVRVMLDLDKSGHPTLALGSGNQAQAILTLSGAGPMLNLMDEKGKAGVLLILDKDGPRLDLGNEKGNGSVSLRVEKSQLGLILRDGEDRGGGILQIMEHGPVLGLSDEKGKIRVWLHVDKDGPGLALFDEKGKSKVLNPYNIPY